MEDKNKNSSTGSLLSFAIPFKLKLGLIVGLLLFLFIFTVPVLIVAVISAPFSGNGESSSEASSEQTVVQGGDKEIVIVDKDGLKFPQDHYVFCYPVTNFKTIAGTFGQSGNLWSRNHTGVDFIGESGAYVVAVANGEINYVGTNPAYGNYAIIKHTFEAGEDSITFYTQYCHMQDNSISVNIGDRVVQGQKIGVQGSTRKFYLRSLPS